MSIILLWKDSILCRHASTCLLCMCACVCACVCVCVCVHACVRTRAFARLFMWANVNYGMVKTRSRRRENSQRATEIVLAEFRLVELIHYLPMCLSDYWFCFWIFYTFIVLTAQFHNSFPSVHNSAVRGTLPVHVTDICSEVFARAYNLQVLAMMFSQLLVAARLRMQNQMLKLTRYDNLL